MTTPLTLDTRRRDDGTLVLVATGEIDLSNVARFSEALDDVIADGAGNGVVTVDLSAVDYLDSGAISVLFHQSGHVKVIANPVLIPVLNISGLADLTSVEPPVSDIG
ncbi:anti-anti-sigma factor [Mycobacterium sp. MS1601]|uniref:STAS domain-containing protein n=1 Tax=Mycobacterium sp. MS1601 TaxID=1936029 RepID=UPI00097911FB|nr:STAS domain-containing protein [Mycobacterium sp. MS1601]AQA05436.1 anti-anti-sigma factor [Mycobacterium sp. MS1601]